MAETFIAMLVVVIYFLPSLNAFGKKNSGAIFALNLLLGWTFFGWAGALIWSCMKD
jgi:Superinfection immunity protein